MLLRVHSKSVTGSKRTAGRKVGEALTAKGKQQELDALDMHETLLNQTKSRYTGETAGYDEIINNTDLPLDIRRIAMMRQKKAQVCLDEAKKGLKDLPSLRKEVKSGKSVSIQNMSEGLTTKQRGIVQKCNTTEKAFLDKFDKAEGRAEAFRCVYDDTLRLNPQIRNAADNVSSVNFTPNFDGLNSTEKKMAVSLGTTIYKNRYAKKISNPNKNEQFITFDRRGVTDANYLYDLGYELGEDDNRNHMTIANGQRGGNPDLMHFDINAELKDIKNKRDTVKKKKAVATTPTQKKKAPAVKTTQKKTTQKKKAPAGVKPRK